MKYHASLDSLLTSKPIQLIYDQIRDTPLGYLGYRRRLAEQRRRRLPIARDLAARILSSQGKNISLEYNNATAAPAFGEYTELVMFARFLNVNGFCAEIIVLDEEGRRDKAWLRSTDDQQSEFLKFQLAFPKKLGIKTRLQSGSRDVNNQLNDTVSLDKLCQPFGYQIYRLAPDILEEMLTLMEGDCKISEFLLNSKSDYLNSNFVTYNLRRNLLWDKDRNQTDYEVITDLVSLNTAYPELDQVILTDIEGSRYFDEVIRNQIRTEIPQLKDVRISTQPIFGFVEASKIVLASRFHLHRRGGGIQAPLIYSYTPYVILTSSVYSHIHRKHHRFHSFSSHNQFVFGRDLSQRSLKKVIQKCVTTEGEKNGK